MAGILRVCDAIIVHPSEGYAQIATLVLLYSFQSGYLCSYPLPIEYNKRWAVFQVPGKKDSADEKIF
jgi:hypothetical protein